MATTLQQSVTETTEVISWIEREAREALHNGTLPGVLQANKDELVSTHH
jgi:hypothetical protein